MNVNRTSRHSGFTLVELLVVMAILGVVTAIVTQGFFIITSQWSDTQMKANLDDRAQNFFQAFSKTVEGIVPPSLSGQSVICSSNDPAGRPSDSITLAAEVSHSAEKGMNYARVVKYEVVRRQVAGVGRVEFIQRSDKPLGGPREGARNQQVAPVDELAGVRGLQIECLDSDGKWDRVWNKDELPVSIRVTVLLTDPDSPRIEVVRSAEFPVRVQPNSRGQWGTIVSETN